MVHRVHTNALVRVHVLHLCSVGKTLLLKSTITSASRLKEFARCYAKHYAAIDALQFDPEVPRWLLEMIWEELAFA